MHRKLLEEDCGMLFAFPILEVQSFWMKNTSLPLSIAFINERGTITNETALELIVNYPSLIKRPVIKRKEIWHVGYDELVFEKICSPASNPCPNEKIGEENNE